MRRDPRLTGLSSEHHGALVLARRIGRACAEGEPEADFVTAVRDLFRTELEPHFRVEEDHLLPALSAAGEDDLVRRTRSDHEHMRELMDRAAADLDGPTLRAFAEILHAHVRFEERELLPAAQAHLGEEQLDEIERVSPHPKDLRDNQAEG